MRRHQKNTRLPEAGYYLYCMNFECRISIYNLNVEVNIPLTAKNLLTIHRCKGCHTPLVSPIDLEIKNVLTEINGDHRERPKHLDN